MESSWYLCAIKVLYTGRATFESRVLTGHRFRGRPKRSALRDAWDCPSSSLLLPLSLVGLCRRRRRSSSSFMSGEVTDLLTMAVDKAAAKPVWSKEASRRGRSKKRFRRDDESFSPLTELTNQLRVTFTADLLLNIPLAFYIAYLNLFLTEL